MRSSGCGFELRNRGIADILIPVVDGLKGFPDSINAVFPQTVLQMCNSMSFASRKDRKAIAQSLRSVYRAENADADMTALEAFGLSLRNNGRSIRW